MKRITFSLLLLIPLALWAQTVEKKIAPGVTLGQKVTADPALVLTWLKIDPKEGARLLADVGEAIRDETPSQGRDRVSEVVKSRRAVAGINADFFPYTGDPLNLCLRNGELISEPGGGRSVIGWTEDGKPLIGIPQWEAQVIDRDGRAYKLAGVNRLPVEDELVLLTPQYGEKATFKDKANAAIIQTLSAPLSPNRTSVALMGAISYEIGQIAIPKTGGVLVGTGKAKEFLTMSAYRNAQLKLKCRLGGSVDWTDCREAVGGGPTLVKKGKIALDWDAQGFNNSFNQTRHPRTAAGVTASGQTLLVTVDGRQPFSRGASLTELAKLMLELGAVEAINLDGGGSSALVARDCMINAPSDGSERPVASLVLVTAPDRFLDTSVAEDWVLQPALSTLKAGDKAQFYLQSASTSKRAPANGIVWGTATGLGFMNQSGVFTATRKGEGVVSAWLNGTLYQARLTVEANPNAAPPPVLPKED